MCMEINEAGGECALSPGAFRECNLKKYEKLKVLGSKKIEKEDHKNGEKVKIGRNGILLG